MKLLSSTPAHILEQLNYHQLYQDPIKRVDWIRFNLDSMWLPEEALSLYGLPEFEHLPEQQKRTLSQLEFLHFMEAQLWLESLFMERLSRAAFYTKDNLPLLKFHINEMREEAGHSLVFIEIIQRSGLPRVPTIFTRQRFINYVARSTDINSVLFWLAMLIGEEIPDRINRTIRKHQSSLCPAIFDVATMHTMDEARHIAFTRRVIENSLKQLPGWKAPWIRLSGQRLLKQFLKAFYFPQAGVYDLAGLVPGRLWAQAAWQNPIRHRFIHTQIASILRSLREQGLSLDGNLRKS